MFIYTWQDVVHWILCGIVLTLVLFILGVIGFAAVTARWRRWRKKEK